APGCLVCWSWAACMGNRCPEYMKASIRAKVEHPFRIIKRQFGFVKARYKGLLKNDNQLAMLFTLANLFRADQMIRQWERSH
ncbi:transposase, partial [Escherichia coli]|uniref:transposase n=1 Tax=Escherichia coli TaxID=562 RepID=UPI0011E964F8